MGVNVIAYKLGDIVKDGDYDTYRVKSRHDFDSARHSGDREFIMCQEFDWDEVGDGYYIENYSRPKNPQEAKEWIKNNIEPEGNKERLLKLMDDMLEDETIYLMASF